MTNTGTSFVAVSALHVQGVVRGTAVAPVALNSPSVGGTLHVAPLGNGEWLVEWSAPVLASGESTALVLRVLAVTEQAPIELEFSATAGAQACCAFGEGAPFCNDAALDEPNSVLQVEL